MSERKDVLKGLEGYTPGPWQENAADLDFAEVYEAGAYDYLIASVRRQWKRDPTASVPRDPANAKDAVTIANTRLIARAPELVEEVRALRAGLRNAIRALEEGRVPRGGDFLGDLRALLPTTGD